MTDTTVRRPSEARATQRLPGRTPRELVVRAVRCGVTAGGVAVFIASIGMVATFEQRTIIAPFLALGYLVLGLVPLVGGWVAGKPRPAVEGYAPPRPGPRVVAVGLLTGLLAGLVLAAFTVLADALDLRRMFIHISPALVSLLTFDKGLATGALLLLGGGGVLGAAGGALHLVPARRRRPLLAALSWVLVVGMLQQLVAQVLSGLGLIRLVQVLFMRGGGLTVLGAILIAVTAFGLYAVLEPRRVVVRERIEALSGRERQRYGAIAAVIGLVVLAVLPLLLGTFLSEIFDLIGIFLLMALGLNIVVGYAGLLDLGYVAFFAVGAYTTAVLTAAGSPRWTPELAFVVALPFVVLAAALAGVVVGTPVLRMRGDYLAIVTLGFGEIARILFLSDWLNPTFGGAQGITRIPPLQIGSLRLTSPTEFFYPIFVFVLLAAYISWALKNSRIGRAWMAMREDESVAEAMGINIVTAKLSAFVVGASLASFAGALFATKIGSIFPHSFQILVSILVLVIIIIGGMGSIPGVVVGAIALVGIPELLREFEEYRFLLYGALLIYMMLNRPEGLVPSRQRKLELHQEEVMQDAWFSDAQRQEEREAPPLAPGRDPDAGLV